MEAKAALCGLGSSGLPRRTDDKVRQVSNLFNVHSLSVTAGIIMPRCALAEKGRGFKQTGPEGLTNNRAEMESHVCQLETFCGTVMLCDPDRIHCSGYVDTDLDTLPYMLPKIK